MVACYKLDMTFQRISRILNYVVVVPLSVLKPNAGLYQRNLYMNIQYIIERIINENLQFKCWQIINNNFRTSTTLAIIISHISYHDKTTQIFIYLT